MRRCDAIFVRKLCAETVGAEDARRDGYTVQKEESK